jgi:hypothetical protein
VITEFEREAELLVVHHLDLRAQIEAQLRAAHHTLRRIERLRGIQHRTGRELTNGQRESTLSALSTELTELDKHLSEEHQCCNDMQATIRQMHAQLAELKQVAQRVAGDAESEPPDESGSARTP